MNKLAKAGFVAQLQKKMTAPQRAESLLKNIHQSAEKHGKGAFSAGGGGTHSKKMFSKRFSQGMKTEERVKQMSGMKDKVKKGLTAAGVLASLGAGAKAVSDKKD